MSDHKPLRLTILRPVTPRRERSALIILAASVCVVFVCYQAAFVPVIDRGRSHKAFVAEARRHIADGDMVIANVGEDHELCYLLGPGVLVPGASGQRELSEGIKGALRRARSEGRGAWYILYRKDHESVPPGPGFHLVAETRGYHRKPLALLAYESPDDKLSW